MKSLLICNPVDENSSYWWTISENRYIEGEIYDGADIVIHYEAIPYRCTVVCSSNSTKVLEKTAEDTFRDDVRFKTTKKLIIF